VFEESEQDIRTRLGTKRQSTLTYAVESNAGVEEKFEEMVEAELWDDIQSSKGYRRPTFIYAAIFPLKTTPL
jgi:hypothetical protein